MPQSPRPYQSPLRENHARATRYLVVSAARQLFIENGWTATTINAIAEKAGVSRKTEFNAVGPKAEILKVALDWALVGDDEPIPLDQRQELLDLGQVADPAELIERWAHFIAALEVRVAPLAHVLAVAADSDHQAAEVHATSERNRSGGARFLVQRLQETGGLRSDVSTDCAVASTLVLMDPAAQRTLMVENGWSLSEYEAWIARAAKAELLDQSRSRPTSRP